MFTSMTSASKPHHVVDADGVTLGYTHFGMLAAARWICTQVGAVPPGLPITCVFSGSFRSQGQRARALALCSRADEHVPRLASNAHRK